MSFFRKVKYMELLESQIDLIKSLGYDVIIDGNKGAGKTTLLTAISQLVPFMFQSMINDIQVNTQEAIPEFPFESFKAKFIDLRERLSFEETMHVIHNDLVYIDDLGQVKYLYGLNDLYSDGLTKKLKLKMINDYFYAFNESLRRTHIYSNIEIFNHFEGYSNFLDLKWLNIKDKQDYPIPDYAFLIIDENSITNGNDNAISRLNADTGSSDRMRLQRNASKGTNYTWRTQQNADRCFKSELELIDCFIHVNKSYLVLVPRFRLNIFKILRNINNAFYNIFKKFKGPFYVDSNNFFKKKLKFFERHEKKLLLKSWLCFDSTIYTDIKNIGKDIDVKLFDSGNRQYKWYFPIWYSWGNVDSFSFRPVFEYLRERSMLKPDDIGRIEINLDYVNDVLKKSKDRIKNDLNSNDCW